MKRFLMNSFFISVIASAQCVYAQLVTGDQNFNAVPGEYSHTLSGSTAHLYDINLSKDEAVVAVLKTTSANNELCYDNVSLLFINSVGTKVDSDKAYTFSNKETKELVVAYKSELAGINRIVIEREATSKCNATEFAYVLAIRNYTGHIDATRKISAVSGIYNDGLSFADVHNYYFPLAKNKTFKALLNINSGIAALCYSNISLSIYNASGTQMVKGGVYYVPKETDVSSDQIEFKSPNSGNYLLQIVREPESSSGNGCDNSVFPYNLHLDLPAGKTCTKKDIKVTCSKNCNKKCKKFKNKQGCNSKCIRKCTTKGEC